MRRTAVEALILAVKPHGVLSLISSLSERGEELPLLISIAAAISLDDRSLAPATERCIVRAMPNHPVHGAGRGHRLQHGSRRDG